MHPYLGARDDVQSVAGFIRVFTTTFNRWPSPKYLLGKSYRTVRSAGVAAELQGVKGMELNGIVLVSSILDYQTKGYVAGNDYPHANFLPSFTASAWYHRKLSKVARFSGLSPDFIEQANLRVTDPRFRKELLRDTGVHIGRLDGRYTGVDADAAGEVQEFDPSNHALSGPYTALFLDYLRRELRWESDLPYYTSGQVQPWNYAPYSNRYLNMVEDLRSAMARNPFLKVMVANGYYDFATPFGAM